MRVRTPQAEKAFIKEAISPALGRLKGDPKALDAFLGFAVKNGADRLLFPGRLVKVIRGEPAPPYLVALLLSWHPRGG